MKALWRVYHSSLNVRQWHKNVRKIQYLNHKCKFYLINLENCAWICAHANYSSKRSHVRSLIPLNNTTLLMEGLINFSILFLKTTKFFEFQRVEPKLFYSMIVEEKKDFLKKLCLILKRNVINVSCSMRMVFLCSLV